MVTLSSLTAVRTKLLNRRERVAATIELVQDNTDLQQLLVEVDAALDRLATGRYGICEICNEQIHEYHLQVDPLRRHCISHLGPRERQLEALKVAATIQRRLLPASHLRLEGWELYFEYAPAGWVGGDYCDVVPGNTGELFLFFGDVMGKDVAASKISSQLNGVFRTLLDLKLPIDEMLERANRIFFERVQVIGYYATLVCGRVSSAGTLELINAGHVPPLLLRSGGAERVVATGMPLGLFCESKYEVTNIELVPGETLLFYTDGVTEARNSSDTEYGTERLAHFATELNHLSPEELIHACRNDVLMFTSSAPQSDDLALLALRRV